MKVLIIGGYGTFGFGIAKCLSDEFGLELILAGRNIEKAKAACASLSGAAIFTPLRLDRNEMDLDFTPDLIIDASGPFQAYDEASVVDYCLANKIPYADISDDGNFAMNVKNRKSSDIPLISGLSTCPVLSAIGLREIERVIGAATDVTIGIAPSPKAKLGRNVVGAVMRYAGQPEVTVRRQAKSAIVHGVTEVRHETICVPGEVPLPRLPFAVADSPDALVLPKAFPKLDHIWTGAGTRPIWMHRLLVALSRAVSKGLFPKLAPFTDLFHKVRRLFPFGVHRGGMIVRASSEAGEASWHLVAEGDHGPLIPTLPVVALVRNMLRGNIPLPGTYSGDEIIGLSDLAPEFETLDISYGLQCDGADLPPYEKIMGDAYAEFHPAIADLHRTDNGRIFTGACTVTRGRNPLSHLVAMVVGFPKSGVDVPVSVTVTPDAKGELWTRDFAGKTFSSHHSMGVGRHSRLITERFGPLAIHMAILTENGDLRIKTQAWSILGIPLPKFLKPGGDVFETQDEKGRFVFHVDLRAPLFGRLCKYEGWLIPQED